MFAKRLLNISNIYFLPLLFHSVLGILHQPRQFLSPFHGWCRICTSIVDGVHTGLIVFHDNTGNETTVTTKSVNSCSDNLSEGLIGLGVLLHSPLLSMNFDVTVVGVVVLLHFIIVLHDP